MGGAAQKIMTGRGAVRETGFVFKSSSLSLGLNKIAKKKALFNTCTFIRMFCLHDSGSIWKKDVDFLCEIPGLMHMQRSDFKKSPLGEMNVN